MTTKNSASKIRINFGQTRIAIALVLAVIILSGCVNVGKNTKQQAAQNTSGGFFITEDNGETWQNRVNIYTTNQEKKTFSTANVIKMVYDPQDPAAIYLGTQNGGILYTYNYGQGWFNTLTSKGAINDIVVHPVNKCVIYAAAHNTIWRTEDCSRTWQSIYFEDRANQFITALGIDYEFPDVIYAGTSDGSFLISSDGGNFWDVLYRFGNQIKEIVVQNYTDSSNIYVLTKSKGLFLSQDSGVSWNDMMTLDAYEASVNVKEDSTLRTVDLAEKPKMFSKISGSKSPLAMAIDYSQPNSLIYVTSYGMFRLLDDHWEQIPLLTPNKKDRIYSVAVNPLDGNEIVYGTNSAFYRSLDNGANWQIKKLPSPAIANILKYSPNSKYLYMGTYVIPK